MKFAESKLKAGIRGISLCIGLIIACAVFSSAWAWERMDLFEPMVIAAADRPKNVSPAYTATISDINRLSKVTESRAAFRSEAFSRILKRGADAVEALKAAAQDFSVDTDARKWALYLLGETASEKQTEEVRDFLIGVVNSGSGRYDWWHRAEAKNGLQRLYERFPKLEKSSSREIEVEKTAGLINDLSGWGGSSLSIRDRLPVDFLPNKKIY